MLQRGGAIVPRARDRTFTVGRRDDAREAMQRAFTVVGNILRQPVWTSPGIGVPHFGAQRGRLTRPFDGRPVSGARA